MRTKQPFRGEIPFTGESGISGIYDYIFQPMLDASGEVEVIVGTTRDVTPSRKAHAQLEFLARLTQKLSTISDVLEMNRIATKEIGEFLGAHRCYFFNAHPDIHHARVWPLLERARIEDILRKNEEALSRTAAVIESSNDAIISKSLDGIIVSWKPKDTASALSISQEKSTALTRAQGRNGSAFNLRKTS